MREPERRGGLRVTGSSAFTSDKVGSPYFGMPIYPSRFVLLNLAAFCLAFAGGCGSSEKGEAKGARTPPAPPVRVAAVTVQDVPLEIRAIGNVEAFSRVEVKSQVAGQLQRVHLEEGQDVKQGQPLFEIDPRVFAQAVRESEAALASSRAALQQAEANYARDVAQARNAGSQATRYAELAAKGVISREQNEQYRTTAEALEKGAEASKAGIESARAAVQGAEAKLGDARLQLSFATVRAPMSGRAGSLTVKAGNLVPANATTPLVVINQVTPVFATFSVPEQSLGSIRSYLAKGRLQVEAVPGEGGGAPAMGALDFIDNEVDRATGTIRLKAKFANTDRRLWPGQFVNVVLRLASENATVAPSAAVQTAQTGNYVFVVKPDGTAEQRTVEVRRAWGDLTVIASGLEAGERVVVDGQLRVRPGAKVQVQGQGGSGGKRAAEGGAGRAQATK